MDSYSACLVAIMALFLIKFAACLRSICVGRVIATVASSFARSEPVRFLGLLIVERVKGESM